MITYESDASDGHAILFAMNYQKLIVAGNLVADAELKSAKEGKVQYTQVRVAVNDAKNHPTFFSITLFGKLAENLTQYLTKGRQILVEGHIEVAENGRFSVIGERVELGRKPNSYVETGVEIIDNQS